MRLRQETSMSIGTHARQRIGDRELEATMTRQLAQNVNTLRAIALVMATLCILAGSLTMPTQSVQAGFTPAPTSPGPTPIPPTSVPPTAIPPTVPPGPAPTRRPGSGGGGSEEPSTAAEAPSAPAPLPKTGHSTWWPSLVLFFWGGSLLLLLPLIGPFHRYWKRQIAARVIRRTRRW